MALGFASLQVVYIMDLFSIDLYDIFVSSPSIAIHFPLPYVFSSVLDRLIEGGMVWKIPYFEHCWGRYIQCAKLGFLFHWPWGQLALII